MSDSLNQFKRDLDERAAKIIEHEFHSEPTVSAETQELDVHVTPEQTAQLEREGYIHWTEDQGNDMHYRGCYRALIRAQVAMLNGAQRIVFNRSPDGTWRIEYA